MEYFFIGVGGTGQRVVNALMRACWMGMFTDTDVRKIHLLVIDKDKDAGNKVNDAIGEYEIARNLFRTDKGNYLAGTEVESFGMWEPMLPGDVTKLKDLAQSNSGAEDVLTAMFTPYEAGDLSKRESDENVGNFADGFKGHPNVGSVYMERAIKHALALENNSGGHTPTPIYLFFKSMRDALNEGIRVFIVGSVFGGTGAAGIPQLIKEIRGLDTEDCVEIGTMFMLPYFKNKPNTNKDIKDNIGLVTANGPTAEALIYYHDQGYLDRNASGRYINRAYFLGLQSLIEVGPYSEGGPSQNNRPVFLEMTAALAARHFYMADINRDAQPEAFFLCHDESSDEIGAMTLSFDDLVGEKKKGDIFRDRLSKSLRFAIYSQLLIYWCLVQYEMPQGNPALEANKLGQEWMGGILAYRDLKNQYSHGIGDLLTHLDNIVKCCRLFLSYMNVILTSGATVYMDLVEYTRERTAAMGRILRTLSQAYERTLPGEYLMKQNGKRNISDGRLRMLREADQWCFSEGNLKGQTYNDLIWKIKNASERSDLRDALKALYNAC